MTSDVPAPGHVVPLCRGCVNQTADLSHPSPCARVRWEGHVHVTPNLTADGNSVACPDFQPTEVAA